MKTNLYYFTGTGNSLAVAKKLAHRLENASIIPIVSAYKNKKFEDNADVVGIIFPLYYLGYPIIVGEFLNKLKLLNAKYIFSAVTRGFRPMGGVKKPLKKLFKEKDKSLNSFFYIDMPNNDIMLFDISDRKKIHISLQKAEIQIKLISIKINNMETHFDFEPFSFMYSIRYPVYLKSVKEAKKNFHVTDKCNSCGICAKFCPFDNITITNNLPEWNNKCQLCEGCINICPQKAIQYGEVTYHKGRYIHPGISINEIIEQKK